MTDAHLMDADCIHGVAWYECAECAKDDPQPPPYPENERFGCVNCGSINHTTGDKDWCPVERVDQFESYIKSHWEWHSDDH